MIIANSTSHLVHQLNNNIAPLDYLMVSLGDVGLQIESSTISIPSSQNLIIDFGPIRNPTTKLYHRSRFRSNFDFFSIKIDHFRSIFD